MLFPMSRNPEEPVYNRIEAARISLGLSRQELADKAGVHYQTIGYLEREEYTKYRADWLRTSPNAEIKSFEPVDIERFYASLMPGKYNNEMFGYVYTLGYITMECLVALKGIDSPTQLIVEVSNGLTFEEAFLKVYGISWKDASPILAKTVSQIFLARK